MKPGHSQLEMSMHSKQTETNRHTSSHTHTAHTYSHKHHTHTSLHTLCAYALLELGAPNNIRNSKFDIATLSLGQKGMVCRVNF